MGLPIIHYLFLFKDAYQIVKIQALDGTAREEIRQHLLNVHQYVEIRGEWAQRFVMTGI